MNDRILYVLLLFFVCLKLLVSCSSSDAPVEPIVNEYQLDGEVFSITSEMSWVKAGGRQAEDQLRLLEPIPDSDLYDLIIFSPKSSSSLLEGSYVYSQTGDVGTYNLEFVHAADGQGELLWYTNGDSGERLEIAYFGKQDGRDVYRVTLSGFVLNYGYWDYLAGKWVSLGQKSFKFSYEGFIAI